MTDKPTPGFSEGRERKGGVNRSPSQVAVRPPPPAPIQHQAHAGRQPETDQQRYRRLFDEMARNIGREAVNYLKYAYPAALEAVPKAAEISLTNHIRNDINFRLKPILEAMIAYHEETQRGADDQS